MVDATLGRIIRVPRQCYIAPERNMRAVRMDANDFCTLIQTRGATMTANERRSSMRRRLD